MNGFQLMSETGRFNATPKPLPREVHATT